MYCLDTSINTTTFVHVISRLSYENIYILKFKECVKYMKNYLMPMFNTVLFYLLYLFCTDLSYFFYIVLCFSWFFVVVLIHVSKKREEVSPP